MDIDCEFIKVLHLGESHKYIGRMFSVSSTHRIEIEFNHRKGKAWAAFHKRKKALLNQNISLKLRLRLFNACVSPVIAYTLAAFPLTQTRYQELDRIQRKMV